MILPSFYRYMESSRHLLLYRLDSSYPVPATLYMPHVETLCLLHCAPKAVSRFLQPTLFPSLRRIYYLSAAPSDTTIHRRYGTRAEWVFPLFQGGDGVYPFYDRMVEGGWGKQEGGLIDRYLVQHRPVAGETWFDMYLPARGIVEGEWYMTQQMSYLHKKHCDGFQVVYPVQRDQPNDRSYIPPAMSTHVLMNPQWVHGVKESRGEDVERAFQRVVLGLSR